MSNENKKKTIIYDQNCMKCATHHPPNIKIVENWKKCSVRLSCNNNLLWIFVFLLCILSQHCGRKRGKNPREANNKHKIEYIKSKIEYNNRPIQ